MRRRYRKSSIPFYLKSKHQNEAMLPVKDIISSYFNKPQLKIPNAPELNEILRTVYKGVKQIRQKRVRKKNTTVSNELKLFSTLANSQAIRQKKYQSIFCSPNWDTKTWNSFNEVADLSPDKKSTRTSYIKRRFKSLVLVSSFMNKTQNEKKIGRASCRERVSSPV